MDRKKILIIGMSLNVGGAEKSLINFLNMIDYEQYDIDLLLFQKRGVFLKQVPNEVNLIDDINIRILFQSVFDTILMRKKSIKDAYLVLIRYLATIVEKLKWKQFDQIRLHRWIDFYSKYISQNKIEYDTAIAYAGGETAYYMVDKVSAARKVYFFHSDYSKINIDADLEKHYVNKVDVVITVSETCRQSLIKLFPEKENDIIVLNNLSSSKLIWKLAKEYTPKEFCIDNNITKIVSVGRLNYIKGFDMAIEAATILKKSGIKFKWVIIGEGEERKKLEHQIKMNGIEDVFQLIGLRENPYPYFYCADIVVQTSRFEGKSVVLDEAKILRKPIIVTNYNSAHNQIDDNINGFIVGMSVYEIANKIEKCILEPRLLDMVKGNIKIDADIEDIERYLKVIINHNCERGNECKK